MTGPDDKPTPDEAAAAEALARALEGDGGPEVPDDALQAAALLRYSVDGGELSRQRQTAILEELLAELPPGHRTPARPAWRRWLAPVGALAALAAATALAVVLRPPVVSPREPAALPLPSVALLDAQSAVARPGGGDMSALRIEMRAYRDEMYTALLTHYEGGPTR